MNWKFEFLKKLFEIFRQISTIIPVFVILQIFAILPNDSITQLSFFLHFFIPFSSNVQCRPSSRKLNLWNFWLYSKTRMEETLRDRNILSLISDFPYNWRNSHWFSLFWPRKVFFDVRVSYICVLCMRGYSSTHFVHYEGNVSRFEISNKLSWLSNFLSLFDSFSNKFHHRSSSQYSEFSIQFDFIPYYVSVCVGPIEGHVWGSTLCQLVNRKRIGSSRLSRSAQRWTTENACHRLYQQVRSYIQIFIDNVVVNTWSGARTQNI